MKIYVNVEIIERVPHRSVILLLKVNIKDQFLKIKQSRPPKTPILGAIVQRNHKLLSNFNSKVGRPQKLIYDYPGRKE